MGDIAGIGPEIIARAVTDPSTWEWCRPLVIGHPQILQRALTLIGSTAEIKTVESLPKNNPHDNTGPTILPCWNPIKNDDTHLLNVPAGEISAHAGQAAHDYLTAAADAALAGKIDAITTAPLNKASLHQAGLHVPGHTEILANICGVDRFAMMLFLPTGKIVRSPHGLAVAHVTLHTSIASVPQLLTEETIADTIILIGKFLQRIGCKKPRIAVCALNPHAGENGLFGDEEQRLIQPAIASPPVTEFTTAGTETAGTTITGPLPADTLIRRAIHGEFDGIVAMYHDQGHIPFKLIGFDSAVNITLGLPIVRTSPSHGTAFDIAWQGEAHQAGLLEAMKVAAQLTATQNR